MPRFRYQLVDVFTESAFGGNQLAVFPRARNVPEELMQPIAKELNLSETTFVLPADDPSCDVKVRIFTPAAELPIAGHPTIGTAYVLASGTVELPRPEAILTLEEGVGPVRVTIVFEDGRPDVVKMSQPLPEFLGTFEDVDAVAACLNIGSDAITQTGLPVEAVSCGVPFLYVPLRDIESVKAIRPDAQMIVERLAGAPAPRVFAFALEAETDGAAAHARMFAPDLGVLEDPATGAAAGPLGCYLARHRGGDAAARFVVEQGFELGRPSFLTVEIDRNGDEITGVRVGGRCAPIGAGYVDVVA